MALTDEERKPMNNVLDELNEYFEVMEKANEFKAFLFEGDWFFDFCKKYRKGGDNTISVLLSCLCPLFYSVISSERKSKRRGDSAAVDPKPEPPAPLSCKRLRRIFPLCAVFIRYVRL